MNKTIIQKSARTSRTKWRTRKVTGKFRTAKVHGKFSR